MFKQKSHQGIILFHLIIASLSLINCSSNKPSNIEEKKIKEVKFIRNVIIEKNTVCVNEDVVVHVEASNPQGADSNLLIRIGDKFGNPAVVKFSRPGEKNLIIGVKDFLNNGMEYKKMIINVEDCSSDTNKNPSVNIVAQQTSTNQNIYEFSIKKPEVFSNRSIYHWDFGDGKTISTRKDNVTYDYSFREQDSYLSTFIVTASIRDIDGKIANGRISISLPNIYYLAKHAINPSIPSFYNKFIEINGNSYQTKITIKNTFDKKVEFKEARLEIRSCKSKDSIESLNLNLEKILNFSSINPRDKAEGFISLDKSKIPPSTCFINVKLYGKIDNTKDVHTSLNLEIKPEGKQEVASTDKVIKDTSLIQKLQKARQILGRDKPITNEALDRLQKEGKI